MKYVINLILLLMYLSMSNCILAQISYGGQPHFQEFIDSTLMQNRFFDNKNGIYKVDDLDMNIILDELDILAKKCKNCSNSFYYGKEIGVNIDFFKSAQNIEKESGEKLCLLKMTSEKAEGYQLIFDKFWLSKGTELFIYNEDKSMILGSFTSENNRSDSTFLTQYINGKNICIEYYAPANSGECFIHIDKIVYIFNDCFSSSKGPFSQDGAAKCHINTSCPQGDGLNIEIKSTVLILEKASTSYWGVCTGVLVNDGNNYKYNNKPYIFTANHCYELENGFLSAPYYWIFLFRHEASNCNSDGSDVSADRTKSALGATVVSRDVGSKINDFLLMQLVNKVQAISKFDIAFAGYDFNEYFVPPGNFMHPLAGIHHPKGDVKKLSISSQPAESAGWNKEGDDHWKVTFTKGFKTEPGSSGSPLFDYRHKLIGMCHGDDHSVTCDSKKELFQSFYGKLSKSSKADPFVHNYLFLDECDSYVPQNEPGSNPDDGKASVKFFINTDGGPENDFRPRLGEIIQVFMDFTNASKVLKIGENIRWRCKINNYPFDFNEHPWVNNDSVTSEVSYSKINAYNAIHSFYSLNYMFKHKGTYRIEVDISGESSGYTKNVYSQLLYLTILDNGKEHKECFNMNLEIYNPKEKYAVGDNVWIKENINIKEGYSNTQTPCYPRHYLSDVTCKATKHYYHPAYKLGALYYYINGIKVVDEKYNTTQEYSDVYPGFFYTPKGFRSFKVTSPGLYTVKVDAYNGNFRDYKTNYCQVIRPDGDLEIDKYYYISASTSFIVANCTGYYKGSSLPTCYLSVKRNLIKDIGLGTIDVDSLKLSSGDYHLEAYDKIILGTGTHIKEGVTFHAEIVPCPSVTSSSPNLRSLMSTDILEPKKNDKITVYPNPTSGNIYILKDDNQVTQVELFDLSGKKVGVFSNVMSQINISHLPDGVYILKIYLGNKTETTKILLNKKNAI